MMIEDLYASLAQMLDYPHDKESLSSALGVVREYLRDERLECSLTLFGGFVAGHTLAEIQEEYVATFDFNPTVAPYLGHHLFGDNQKKGTYLITLKGEYGRTAIFLSATNSRPPAAHTPVSGFLTRGGGPKHAYRSSACTYCRESKSSVTALRHHVRIPLEVRSRGRPSHLQRGFRSGSASD